MKHVTIKSALVSFAILTLVSSAFVLPSIGGVGLGRMQNNLIWSIILIFFSFTFFYIYKKEELVYTKTLKYLLLGLSITILPFFLTNQTFLHEGYLLPLGLLGGVALYFSLIQFSSIKNIRNYILYFILAISTIQILLGFYQTIGAILYNLSSNTMTFDPAPLGSFDQKNIFASFMSTSIAISGYLVSRKSLKSYEQLILLVISFLAVFLLAFSNSRIGFIGGLIVVIILTPYLFKIDKKKCFVWLGLIFSALIFALLLLKSTSVVPKQFTSGGARVGIYITSLNTIADAPILGHGLGSFESVFADNFPLLYNQNELPKDSWAVNLSHPHNEFLLWGIEGGLLSVSGLLFIMLVFMHSLYRSTLPFGLKLVRLAILTPIFLHSMVELPFELSSIHFVTFILLVFYALPIGPTFTVRLKTSAHLTLIPLAGAFLLLNVILLINIYSLNITHNFLISEKKDYNYLNKAYLMIGWKNEYDGINKGTLMNIGVQNKNPDLINQYILWASETMKVSPRIEYYQNLIVGYHQLGDIKKAKAILAEMNDRYPNHKKDKWVNSFLAQLKNAKVD